MSSIGPNVKKEILRLYNKVKDIKFQQKARSDKR
jgi:hypothetical protein